MVKDLTKLLIVGVVGVVAMAVLVLIIVAVPTVIGWLSRPQVHEVTSPLETSVAGDLCRKLSLSTDDPICLAGATVYAPDFFPAVRAEFVVGLATYEDVQEQLSDYQDRCDASVTLSDGASYTSALRRK